MSDGTTMLLLGAFFLILGFRLKKQGATSYGGRTKERWLKVLRSWGVAADADQAEIVEYFQGILSTTVIGVGCGSILAALSYLLFVFTFPVFARPGSFLLLPSSFWFIGIFLGDIVGYTIGVQQQRRAAQRSRTYADLRQRGLADYRSPLLPTLATLLILSFLCFTWAIVIHSGPSLSVQDLFFGDVTTLPSFPWLIWIFPAGMILILLMCEGAMRLVVSLPRLLLTTDPQRAQQTDEVLRVVTIGNMQAFELVTIGTMSLGQWLLLRNESWSLAPLGTSVALGVILLLLGVGGLYLLSSWCVGRVGGKMTGWPWRKRVIA